MTIKTLNSLDSSISVFIKLKSILNNIKRTDDFRTFFRTIYIFNFKHHFILHFILVLNNLKP